MAISHYWPHCAAQSQGFQYLWVAGQQLAPFCHSGLSWATLALPGQDVLIVQGAIRPGQIRSNRPSYVNAVLIQRAGALYPGTCAECRRRPRMWPFPECRVLRGHFGDSCGNCKWRDYARRCHSGSDDGRDDDGSASEDDSDSYETADEGDSSSSGTREVDYSRTVPPAQRTGSSRVQVVV